MLEQFFLEDTEVLVGYLVQINSLLRLREAYPTGALWVCYSEFFWLPQPIVQGRCFGNFSYYLSNFFFSCSTITRQAFSFVFSICFSISPGGMISGWSSNRASIRADWRISSGNLIWFFCINYSSQYLTFWMFQLKWFLYSPKFEGNELNICCFCKLILFLHDLISELRDSFENFNKFRCYQLHFYTSSIIHWYAF